MAAIDEFRPAPRVRSLGLKRQGTTRPGFVSNKNAIVYDPSRQRLLKDWIDLVEGDDQYIKVPVNGRGCIVDINIEVGSEKTKVYLASVNLARLGQSVKWQRKLGRIGCVYVLGQVRDGWHTEEIL